MTKQEKLEFRRCVVSALELMISRNNIYSLDGDPVWGKYASWAKKKGLISKGHISLSISFAQLTKGGERFVYETGQMLEVEKLLRQS